MKVVALIAGLVVAAWALGLACGALADPRGNRMLDRLGRLVRAHLELPRARRSALARRPDSLNADGHNWPTYGGDYGAARYSPLKQVNLMNVHRLQLAWVHQSRSVPEKQESTPLAIDGVIYYTAPSAVVIAVNAKNGFEMWRYEHHLDAVPLVCCGIVNRGAAVYGDKIYFATVDDFLVAVNRFSGKLVWQTLADSKVGYSMTMAPLAVDGRIIVGSSGGDYGNRGFVDAYDAETGTRLWRFWTVPSPEEGGWWGRWSRTTVEGDTLSRDIERERADSARYAEAWRQGGGAVWMTPSYDRALKMIYFGTGNPSPAIEGPARPGDNLYTASIVALDAEHGTLRWYYQVIPHDMGDRDITSPVVLFDAQVGDSTVAALAQGNKTGWVYVLDRRTGKRILRSKPFVPQKNLFAAPTWEGVLSYPSIAGGNQWTPAAYSPRTGLLYVQARHKPMRLTLAPGSDPAGGDEHFVETSDSTVDFPPSVLAAVDLQTGDIRWQRYYGELLDKSGVLATAGDLVFFGTGQHLAATDARTGRLLWRFQTGAAVYGAPITFEFEGEQYICVASGSALFAFKLGQ